MEKPYVELLKFLIYYFAAIRQFFFAEYRDRGIKTVRSARSARITISFFFLLPHYSRYDRYVFSSTYARYLLQNALSNTVPIINRLYSNFLSV